MARQMQKVQENQLAEDKMTADFYETQNRLMTEQKKYYKNVKWYHKWLEKVWNPFMQQKQEERERMAKDQAEAEKKVRDAMAKKPVTIDTKTNSDPGTKEDTPK